MLSSVKSFMLAILFPSQNTTLKHQPHSLFLPPYKIVRLLFLLLFSMLPICNKVTQAKNIAPFLMSYFYSVLTLFLLRFSLPYPPCSSVFEKQQARHLSDTNDHTFQGLYPNTLALRGILFFYFVCYLNNIATFLMLIFHKSGTIF